MSGLTWFILALVVVGLAVGGYMLYRHLTKNQPKANAVAPAPSKAGGSDASEDLGGVVAPPEIASSGVPGENCGDNGCSGNDRWCAHETESGAKITMGTAFVNSAQDCYTACKTDKAFEASACNRFAYYDGASPHNMFVEDGKKYNCLWTHRQCQNTQEFVGWNVYTVM